MISIRNTILLGAAYAGVDALALPAPGSDSGPSGKSFMVPSNTFKLPSNTFLFTAPTYTGGSGSGGYSTPPQSTNSVTPVAPVAPNTPVSRPPPSSSLSFPPLPTASTSASGTFSFGLSGNPSESLQRVIDAIGSTAKLASISGQFNVQNPNAPPQSLNITSLFARTVDPAKLVTVSNLQTPGRIVTIQSNNTVSAPYLNTLPDALLHDLNGRVSAAAAIAHNITAQLNHNRTLTVPNAIAGPEQYVLNRFSILNPTLKLDASIANNSAIISFFPVCARLAASNPAYDPSNQCFGPAIMVGAEKGVFLLGPTPKDKDNGNAAATATAANPWAT